MSPWKTRVLLSFVLASSVPACGGGSSTGYEVEGKVRAASGKIVSMSEDRSSAKIAHGEIEDFMPAMTMEFFFQEPALAQGLEAGQEVSFQFAMARSGKMVIVSLDPG